MLGGEGLYRAALKLDAVHQPVVAVGSFQDFIVVIIPANAPLEPVATPIGRQSAAGADHPFDPRGVARQGMVDGRFLIALVRRIEQADGLVLAHHPTFF
jgi:hypothetical protein